MTDKSASHGSVAIEQDYQLDEPPEKVWRALTIPALRNHWLPEGDLSDPDAVHIEPGKAISYRMRDAGPYNGESVVTFQIHPEPGGKTRLQIVHTRPASKFDQLHQRASNNNFKCFFLAA
ncbi:SRPBCC domain-containing protein [Labrenzia sp. PHM005]|uniref:SRPBCC family protein n=1 Tax=Labrenzia sp. PHM005 TaxID=2590016 RepID=UPI0011405C04|nr:SRPBCC domain-containing protein [Labrenzia sp. PHM005]QDG75195.1 polyketide cyclase [Labrenzia sp. PHM005]